MTHDELMKALECHAEKNWCEKCPIQDSETCSMDIAREALKVLDKRQMALKTVMTKLGYWKQLRGAMTPGGTPLWACGGCGESVHLHGVEYPKRKMICDGCGRINIYPGETAYEYKSSLWEDDDDA